jgi:hypothetical protein
MRNIKVMGFVGATDPESEECRRVLRQFGSPCAQALFPGVGRKRPVESMQAYDELITFNEPIADSVKCMIFMECAVPQVLRDKAEELGAQILVCDHHNPGDPGFDMGPKDFLKGSSLGQLLNYCGIDPSPEQRIIAALDHCLSAAARGECPGVDPKEAFDYRCKTRAKRMNIPLEKVLAEVDRSVKRLATAPRMILDSEEVVCLTTKDFKEYRELATAAAWFEGRGIGYVYERLNPFLRVQKYGVMGVTPKTVEYWKTQVAPKMGIAPARTYWCGARGYAGGYASI